MTESNAALPARGSFMGRLAADPWRAALWLVGIVGLIRLVALFTTPLELYPDEAQYWTWSHTLDFGYWSKPPMVAWLIAATTAVGGDDEPWIRLSSLLLHLGTALVLFQVAARLGDRRAGFWSAFVYTLMPGVTLASGLVSTDSALLFFLSLALWAYAELFRADEGRRAVRAAAGLGLALGLAILSKYAALYFAGGVLLHSLVDRRARSAWSLPRVAITFGLALLVALPNLLWNAAHKFATVRHTADNADLKGGLFHIGALGEFLGGQLGLFGPVAFVALVVIAVMAIRRRSASDAEVLLWCIAGPPLLLVTVLAFVTRANTNWAAAAYIPGSVMVGIWLAGASRTLWWRAALVGVQGLLAFVLTVAAISPAFADGVGLGNSLKRNRGWAEMTRLVLARADRETLSAPLTAVAVDDRFPFYALAYYGRDWFARPGAPPLKIWVRNHAGNQAEATAPLTSALGGRVLMASTEKSARGLIARDFGVIGPLEERAVRLDRKHDRDVVIFVGEDFKPQPRGK